MSENVEKGPIMKKGIITEAEYLEELGGLYDKVRREMPDASDQDIYIIYQEREFDLLIDFRLGDDFPDERRNALKKLQHQDVCRMEEFKSKLLSGDMSADGYAEAIQELVKQKMADLSALLDSNELKSLCGDGLPGIPLDFSLIGIS
jgi:hypothetical protein